MIESFNPYEILGVEINTSAEGIKKAFKAKSKVAHPDHGGNVEDFDALKKAYDNSSRLRKTADVG
jgi:curved DNA-binding protein CbpA